jgi:hypothetical protein
MTASLAKIEFPPDLTLKSLPDLQQLETDAVTAFNALKEKDTDSATLAELAERTQEMLRLSDGIRRVRAQIAGLQATAAAEEADRKADLAAQSARLDAAVNGGDDDPDSGGGSGGGDGASVDFEALAAMIAESSAKGATAAIVASLGERNRARMDQAATTKRAVATLSQVRERAPAPTPGEQGALIAGITSQGGQTLTDMEALANEACRVADSVPITHNGIGARTKFATIKQQFAHVVDPRTKLTEMQDLIAEMTSADKQTALLAGGGWCAPSEIRYELFNIADMPVLVDLPTVGVSRGGLRYPTTPSLADGVYTVGGTLAGLLTNQNLAGFGKTFDSASVPWLWLETDDIATVTGTGSPNKPTLRVPCPSFVEARLEAYGIQLTAGNLTNDAYPESTQNTIKLLMSAWQRAKNLRIVQQMVALSAPVVSGGSFNGAAAFQPAFNQIINGLSLGATDYRSKFGMSDEAVLECILPEWVPQVITADLGRRTNADQQLLSIVESAIIAYFADRQVRVQFVSDWQQRGAGLIGNPTTPVTAWPATVDALLYAAGTFLLGNGLSLDLGVVRDSVLNAENDYTALFSEEAHLVARVGHESRLYRITYAVNGAGTPNIAALGTYL